MLRQILVVLILWLALLAVPIALPAQTGFWHNPTGTRFYLQSDQSRATDLVALAHEKHVQGKYAEAEALLTRALEIDVRTLGPDHPAIASLLNNLAETYREQGKYADAEQLYLRSISIDEKAFGPENKEMAAALNNLGLLYKEENRYSEAEALHWRALRITTQAFGRDSLKVAITLNCLASLYTRQGRYSDAEPLLRRSLDIRQELLPPDHPDIGTALNNLASAYGAQGKHAEAQRLLDQALAIDEKSRGSEHPVVAMDLVNLAQVTRDQGKYAEAERYYLRALSIKEKSLGSDHPETSSTLWQLASLYYLQANYLKASPMFKRGLESIHRQFQYNFSYMSEQDRLSFLATVAGDFATYFSFCSRYYGQDRTLASAMYDVLLWQKGAIAASVASLWSKVASSGDKATLDLLDQLTARRANIARLLSSSSQFGTETLANIEALQEEARQLERDLAKRTGIVAERNRLESITWRDVQKALTPGEAAIEFVRFGFDDGKKRTGATKYVALVLTSGLRTSPAQVILGDADDLEIASLQDYWHRVESRSVPLKSGVRFYQTLWKPLEPKLSGVTRVYVSPDGLLNQISLAAVPTENERLLIEKYDIRVVLSTKDLLRKNQAFKNRSAVLIGDPQFDLGESQQRAILSERNRNLQASSTGGEQVAFRQDSSTLGRGLRSQDQPGQRLNRLPGTAEEVESVATLLSAAHWQVETFTGENALEETVKRLKGTRVLHIATHGFFEPDQNQANGSPQRGNLENTMLRSGLYFAGADRVLSGIRPATDIDDGVLTAYEATGLNLQETELVVLSACETGLGESSNGEGVFGLRRALQEAGAQAVLMSMWKVPDHETRQLMTLFYKNWLSGKDKQTALREAELELRKDVIKRWHEDRPHDWAAFVLVSP